MKKLDLYWKSKKEWRILQNNGTYVEQIKRDIS